MTSKEQYELLKQHISVLKEHFDTVQIFVTIENPDDSPARCTRTICEGDGNWYARYGQVKEWIAREESIFIEKMPSPETPQ